MRQVIRPHHYHHYHHSVAILAQVRRLSHGIFGGLGGVAASHLLEASRSEICLVRTLCADSECRLPETTSLLVCSSLCRHC